ncbi:MAG: GMC family oxidoreductase N-terminal domain-containing protein, partial [Bdellovibrionales bacterium]|nr:GMC family oxidoreductase N-terminal domain-containing protein [Bdellovibrionales bacterium]
WMSLHHTPTCQLGEDEIEVDVVVIGSGAGGAACAYRLATKGHAVAVIEEGPYYKRPDMNGDRLAMAGRLYSHGGNSFVISNSPIWLPTGKCVGGTTTINSGTVMRPPAEVLDRWQQIEGLGDLDLEKYFPEVEQMLNSTPTPERYQGGIRKVLEKGVVGQGVRFGPLNRAEKGCDGQSFCTSGCPTAAKQSTDVSYMQEALKANAFLFSHYKVNRLIVNRGEVRGLEASLPGYGETFPLKVRARAVVLAAGSLGTPHLMWKSGLGKSLPQLGMNLTLHPALTMGALFDYPVRESQFVPQSMGVFGYGKGKYVLEGYTLPIDTIPIAFGCFGQDLKEIMDGVDGFTNFSAMLTDQVKGRLRFGVRGSTPVYFVDGATRALLRESLGVLGEIFFRAG